MPGSHLALHLVLGLDTVVVDPAHWRLFQWRKVTPANLAALAVALDLVWGLLACTDAHPDLYIAALHAIASRFVPSPRPQSEVLRRLHRPRPPEPEEEITAWAAELEQARESTSRGLKAAERQRLDLHPSGPSPPVPLNGPVSGDTPIRLLRGPQPSRAPG